MNLSDIKTFNIPEGEAVKLEINGQIVWTKKIIELLPPPLESLSDPIKESEIINLNYPEILTNGINPNTQEEVFLIYDKNEKVIGTYLKDSIKLVPIQEKQKLNASLANEFENAYIEVAESGSLDELCPELLSVSGITLPYKGNSINDKYPPILSSFFYVNPKEDILQSLNDNLKNNNSYFSLKIKWPYQPQILEGKILLILSRNSEGEWHHVPWNCISINNNILTIDLLYFDDYYGYNCPIVFPSIVSIFMVDTAI